MLLFSFLNDICKNRENGTILASTCLYLILQIVNVTFQDRRPRPTKADTEVHEEKKKMPSGVTMVIVIAAVGGVCCVALVILQVVVRFYSS